MTDHAPQPPMPDFPPPQQPTPARKPRNWVIIGSAAAVIAAVIGTGIFVVQAVNNDDDKPAASASSAPAEDPATAADVVEEEPSFADITADSFTMTLRTTERQCFGSAGCNVTVEPELAYTGSDVIDPDAVYDITYEIKGDKSGTVIETAELSNATSLNYTPTSISTASASTKISVKVTDVTPRS